MTLGDVSSRTGIAVSTLSKLENGRASLSYAKLLRLSEGLGVQMSRLVDAAARPAVVGARRVVRRHVDGEWVEKAGHRQQDLAAELLTRCIEPVVAEIHLRTLPAFLADAGGWLRRSGEVFVYVLEGELLLHTEHYAAVHLISGDSIYFDGEMGHAWVNATESKCRCLIVAATRSV